MTRPMTDRTVPTEPTWEMQIAGRDAILSEDDTLDISTDDARAAYIAMLAASPSTPADVEPVADLEEAIRLAEVGEYLYSSRAYSYGDGYTEPREYGIDWQWQQSKPDEYGQGVLLAEAVKWHKEQAEDGTITEAAKLRAYFARALSPIDPAAIRAEAEKAALERAAQVAAQVAEQMPVRTHEPSLHGEDIAEAIRALIDKEPGR